MYSKLTNVQKEVGRELIDYYVYVRQLSLIMEITKTEAGQLLIERYTFSRLTMQQTFDLLKLEHSTKKYSKKYSNK